jgi:hypothetical protein
MICCLYSGGYYGGRVLGIVDSLLTSLMVSTLLGQLHLMARIDSDNRMFPTWINEGNVLYGGAQDVDVVGTVR